MLMILASLIANLSLFAIGGGGGSGGGGGGGGGGSSGGGGFSGGSSSSGGGSSEFDPLAFIIFAIVFVVIIVLVINSGRYVLKQARIRRAKMKADLAIAAAADVIWEQGSLETHARDTFLQYQKDWSTFNVDSMKTYMTPRYYQHNMLMMAALKLAARQNDVQEPSVLSGEVFHFKDEVNNSKDTYTVVMTVHARDVLKDTADDATLFTQNLTAVEYYKFKRSKKKWLFDGIDEGTADPTKRNIPLETFAAENNFFYSLDWGHLLLPRRGQLFSSGSFGVSDINNHVIGLYKDIVIQLYTYIPRPAQTNLSYLIAQTAIPKSYGNIVVRRRYGFFSKGVKGLRRIKMEWQDFNSMYDVFASDAELATSFELLNPKFMEQLQALPFEINIEVVDNLVYLYAPENGVLNDEHYATMLTILKTAFKEMRL